MSRSITIKPYDSGPGANLYVVQFDGTSECEMDAMFRREMGVECSAEERRKCLDDGKGCRRKCRRQEYLNRLYELVKTSVEDGFRPEFFRPFDNYRYPSVALQAGPYRLFGMRFDSEIFVAGGGGIKFVRRDRDDPVLDAALKDLNEAARRLRKRMRGRGLDHPPRDENGLLHLPDTLIDQPFLP